MFIYIYIDRERERECVCVNWPPNPVVARYSRISWRPLIEKSSALGISQWKVNSADGSKMWHQLAVWCSLPTNEYKWCNWFTVPMIWVCPKRVSQNHPKGVRFLPPKLPWLRDYTPISGQTQGSGVKIFFWAMATSSQKRKFASSPIFHPWIYTHPWATLGSWFFLRCHVTVDLDLEIKKSSQLPPEVRASRWVSLHRFAARLAVLGAAQRFPHAKERKWEWRLTYQNLLPWNLQIAMEHPMKTARPWPRNEWKDYRNAWWCMAIWHPHFLTFGQTLGWTTVYMSYYLVGGFNHHEKY